MEWCLLLNSNIRFAKKICQRISFKFSNLAMIKMRLDETYYPSSLASPSRSSPFAQNVWSDTNSLRLKRVLLTGDREIRRNRSFVRIINTLVFTCNDWGYCLRVIFFINFNAKFSRLNFETIYSFLSQTRKFGNISITTNLEFQDICILFVICFISF